MKLWVSLLLWIALPAAIFGQALEIQLSTITEGDANWDWTQARTAFARAPEAHFLTTMSRTAKRGAHGYHDVYLATSRDGGRSWSAPVVIPSLRRARQPDGYEVVAGDLWPGWHRATSTILVTGKTFNFAGGAKENFLREKISYAVIDPSNGVCGLLRTVEMPESDHQGKPFVAPNAGCHQRVELPGGDILLPVRYQKDAAKRNYTSIVARCRFDGKTLSYIEHGTEHSIPTGRGLYEPSVTRFGKAFYLTMRADDGAYVAKSQNGIDYARHKLWTFDDGQPLGSYNTQQHWVTLAGKLYLIYTRRGADNDHIMRHRAPLFIAQVDPVKLHVLRATEQIVVPENHATLGNSGVCRVSDHQCWVTVAEGRVSYGKRAGENNKVILAKIAASETPASARRRHQRVGQRRGGVHIICHRGAVEFAHENTLEAYRAAFQLGADGNEIDIRATKDGTLVCFHDDMVDHLLDAYGDVADYTWDELRKLPFRKPGRFGKHCRIPTVREAFELHRQHAGLMHLDIKRPGLLQPIGALLDEFDMWDHVVQAPANLRDPRYRPTRGKASMYLDRSEVDSEAIAKALAKPGERITLEYPQGVATALGRKVLPPTDQPVMSAPAVWSTESEETHRDEERTVEQLLRVVRDTDDDWKVVAQGADAEARSAERILRRARAADQLARRGVATSDVFAVLEERVRHRGLHRNWRYCGLDGAASLRALFELKAPQAVDVARFCLWRDDPAVEAARNPQFDNPRSWTDWRTKTIVFNLLESVPGPATARLCRDYLALGEEDARAIGVPQFEAAARTLLAARPSADTVKELLGHRLSVVRGRAILFCLAHANEPWAEDALRKLGYLTEPRRGDRP